MDVAQAGGRHALSGRWSEGQGLGRWPHLGSLLIWGAFPCSNVWELLGTLSRSLLSLGKGAVPTAEPVTCKILSSKYIAIHETQPFLSRVHCGLGTVLQPGGMAEASLVPAVVGHAMVLPTNTERVISRDFSVSEAGEGGSTESQTDREGGQASGSGQYSWLSHGWG